MQLILMKAMINSIKNHRRRSRYYFASNNGKSIRFNENQIKARRKTKGVRGIRMSFDDDFVIGMLTVRREGQVLVVSSNGFGKRSEKEYREQKEVEKEFYIKGK